MLRLPTLTALASTALLTAAAAAPAEPVFWSYTWSPTVAVNPDAGGTGGITLESAAREGHAHDNADLLAVTLSTFGDPLPGTPDRYTRRPYQLALEVTDDASQDSHTFTFTGSFGGTVTATEASLTNSFDSPASQTFVLGGHSYTASLGSYFAPGGPGGATGSIHAQVTLDDVSPPRAALSPAFVRASPSISASAARSTPEPSTSLLAGIGLCCLGGTVWRRYRRVLVA